MGPASGASDLYFDKFSVNMSSSIEVGFTATLFDFYQYDIRGTFVPFDLTPLMVTLRIVRPEAMIFSGKPFDLNVQLGYRVKLAEIGTSTTVNMKGIKKSFVDWFKDLAAGTNTYTIYPSQYSDLVYNSKPN